MKYFYPEENKIKIPIKKWQAIENNGYIYILIESESIKTLWTIKENPYLNNKSGNVEWKASLQLVYNAHFQVNHFPPMFIE